MHRARPRLFLSTLALSGFLALAVFAAVATAAPFPDPAPLAPVEQTPAIINGAGLADADVGPVGRWGHLVALVSSGGASAYETQVCGGSLVAPRWVLTAAHCVWADTDSNGREELTPASWMDVVAGRRDLTTGGGARVGVDLVISHPNYVPGITEEVDLALLRLSSEVPASAGVPIALATPGLDSAIWSPGSTLWSAGWGNTTPTFCPGGSGCTPAGPSGWPQGALEVDLPRVDDGTCGSGPAPGYASFVPGSMLCAGIVDTDGNAGTTNARDTCQGDSGGPLIADPGAGVAARRLVGVVSFGVGCGSENYGVYARVDTYASWVNAQIAANGAGGGGGGGGTTLDPRGGSDAAPGAPTSVTLGGRSYRSLTLSWDEPASGGEVFAYEVEVGDEVGEWLDASTFDRVITGIMPGARVDVRVRAHGAGGESPWVSVVASTRRDLRAPSAAGLPVLRATRSGIRISWAAARDDDLVGRYLVEVRVGRAWRLLSRTPGGRRSLVVRQLPAGSGQVAIRAVDASGNIGPRSRAARLR